MRVNILGAGVLRLEHRPILTIVFPRPAFCHVVSLVPTTYFVTCNYLIQNSELDILGVIPLSGGSAVGSGPALQSGKLRIRFPMGSLGLLNDLILPVALCPWGPLSL